MVNESGRGSSKVVGVKIWENGRWVIESVNAFDCYGLPTDPRLYPPSESSCNMGQEEINSFLMVVQASFYDIWVLR